MKLSEEEKRAIIRNFPTPKKKPKPEPKPALALVAGGKPGEQIASVALEGKDFDRVRGALAGRRVRIGEDVVGFDKVTEARVTMRWMRPTPAEAPAVGAVHAYNPFARERMPGNEYE